MTTSQELRQAAAQAKEALSLLYANSNGNSDDEISARLCARVALSALSAVLEAPTGEARSGSGAPARPTLPGEDERARFEAWCRTRPGHPFAGAFLNLMWAAWQARAALAASPLPQEGRTPLQWPEPEAYRGVDRVDVGVGVARDVVLRWDRLDEDDEPLYTREQLREMLGTFPPRQVRMLTKAERIAATDNVVVGTHAWVEALVAKFCEVNGIAIAGTQGEQKP